MSTQTRSDFGVFDDSSLAFSTTRMALEIREVITQPTIRSALDCFVESLTVVPGASDLHELAGTIITYALDEPRVESGNEGAERALFIVDNNKVT